MHFAARKKLVWAGFGLQLFAFILDKMKIEISPLLLNAMIFVAIGMFAYGVWPTLKLVRFHVPISFTPGQSAATINVPSPITNWMLLCMTFVMVALMTWFIVPRNQDSVGDYHDIVPYYGVSPPDKADMTIDTKRLEKFAQSHRLIVICIPTADRIDAKSQMIAKSAAYRITGETLSIVTTLPRNVMRYATEHSIKALTCYPSILPNNIDPSEIVMIESVFKLGGQILGNGKMIAGSTMFP